MLLLLGGGYNYDSTAIRPRDVHMATTSPKYAYLCARAAALRPKYE